MTDVSHCCLAPVETDPAGFPYVCKNCNGSCELGNPETHTYDQQVDVSIFRVIQAVKSGQLDESQAFTKISDIITEEIDSWGRNVIFGIKHEIKPYSKIIGNSAEAKVLFERVNEILNELLDEHST